MLRTPCYNHAVNNVDLYLLESHRFPSIIFLNEFSIEFSIDVITGVRKMHFVAKYKGNFEKRR